MIGTTRTIAPLYFLIAKAVRIDEEGLTAGMLVCLCLYTIVLHSGFSYLLPLFASPSPLSGVHPSLLHSGLPTPPSP